MKGSIFDMQRCCLHDGPGIRTTVFLKGCPLRCLWCSNPESQSPKPLLSYAKAQCIACGSCLAECPTHALSRGADGKTVLDRALCNVCGKCPAVCDAKALEVVGRDVEPDAVLAVVLRDKDYYKQSGGGMTLSGGDPLLQPDFAEALLRGARQEGIHCAIETSGFAPGKVIEQLRPLVDLWLFDWKETDPKRHQEFTRVPNEPIRKNLERLHAAGAKILLRCPLIPEHNARTEHLDGIVALARSLPHLEGVEVLPYFDLWQAKIERFGLERRLPDSVKPPDRATIKGWNDHLRERGVRVVG